jgi:AAA+ ATPase superfamily predicted ATPase
MKPYVWEPRSRFRNRVADLERLEDWWEDPTRDAMALVGRRRVGKSWLLRRFADGKPSVILVADTLLLTQQMRRFAKTLERSLGMRPALISVADLLQTLYTIGRDQKLLAVIDEFPFLLPEGKAKNGVLTEIQAVMEEHRDRSQTKLVLCGSLIGQMEGLLQADQPLHGRLQRFDVWPLEFAESKAMTDPADSPQQRIVRSAIAGGMARYLSELGHGPIREAVCQHVLNRRGTLFNDPRAVLEQELRSPSTYFSLLKALTKPTSAGKLAEQLQIGSSTLAPYLAKLREARLISSTRPVGATESSRANLHRVTDGFIRFWFQFVLDNQEDLQEGLAPDDLWDALIEPHLAEFVAPAFEDLCRRYARRAHGALAPTVGGWWGPALNAQRRARTRISEEVDVVGARHKQLQIAGECKWTSAPMPKSVLDDLRDFKIPALEQAGGLRPPAEGPRILLFSRSGFSDALTTAAAADTRIELIGLDALVAELDRESA